MSEIELVQRVLAGDLSAQKEFYGSMKKRLSSIPPVYLGLQDPECEDIVQQAFLIAYQKLGEYDPTRASLYTWMAHICINLCYERLRKRKREVAQLQEEIEGLTVKHGMSTQAASDEDNEKTGRIEMLRRSVEKLGEKCRQIIRFRDYDGESYAKIGLKMKMPMGTVMSRLARCRENLKQLVLQELERGS